MTYQVFNCLSDTEIAVKQTRIEAEAIQEQHGGVEKCVHVFDIEEIKEKKPLEGMLF